MPGRLPTKAEMKRAKKITFASAVLALIGFAVWQFGPFKAAFAISNLSDPAKLQTLGERGANSRLNKIVYWLDVARHRGFSPDTTIGWAQALNGTRDPRASLVKTELARNMKIADELGLLTSENLDRLRRGHAAIITSGPYSGETVEIDHIVPFSLAPECGNELANLEMLPKTLNRKKSNHVGERQISHAEKLFDAGLLKKESLEKVRHHAKP